MPANTNDASQPLLQNEKQGYTVVYVDDEQTASSAEQVAAFLRVAEEHRRRHQRRRRLFHFACITGLIALFSLGFLVRHVPLFFMTVYDSPALDGPLELSGPQCRSHGAPISGPTLSFPVVFGDIGNHPSFSVHQNTTPHSHHHPPPDAKSGEWTSVHITGDVVYRRAGPGEEPSAVVETVYNDDRIMIDASYDTDTQALHIVVDDLIWVEGGVGSSFQGRPCAVVRVTVWVPNVETLAPAGSAVMVPVHLKSLRTAVVHLGIKLIEDLDLVASEDAFFGSVAGAVRADIPLTDGQATKKTAKKTCAHKHKHLKEEEEEEEAEIKRDDDDNNRSSGIQITSAYRVDAPDLHVKTVSGSIAGPFTLMDFLLLETVSGSVHAKVLPQDDYIRDSSSIISSEHSKTATLKIETVSGAIDLYEVDTGVQRTHGVVVATTSGQVTGSASFSDWADVDTVSGQIELELLAIRPDPATGGARLTTKTTSGQAHVALRTLDDALDWLDSHHASVSGAIRLDYPASWAGHALLKTLVSGKLSVAGKDVHVIPDHKPRWPPVAQRTLEAFKGALPASNVTAVSTSSLISLSFPE